MSESNPPSLPVAEHVALHLLAALQAAPGCTAERRAPMDEDPIRDGRIVLDQGDAARMDRSDDEYDRLQFEQRFDAVCEAVYDPDEGVAVDAKLNRMLADAHAAAMADPQRGGWAAGTTVDGYAFDEITANGSHARATLMLTVQYRVREADPYSRG